MRHMTPARNRILTLSGYDRIYLISTSHHMSRYSCYHPHTAINIILLYIIIIQLSSHSLEVISICNILPSTSIPSTILHWLKLTTLTLDHYCQEKTVTYEYDDIIAQHFWIERCANIAHGYDKQQTTYLKLWHFIDIANFYEHKQNGFSEVMTFRSSWRLFAGV